MDPDLLVEIAGLATEKVSADLRDLDMLPTGRILQIMNEMDREVPAAVERVLPQITAAVDDIAARLARGGSLIYLGAGTPGRLGILDASECPPTFNTDPGMVVGIIAGGDSAIRLAVENAEDDPGNGARDLDAVGVGPLDTVVGISASGRTPYVVGGLTHARNRGALTVAVACNPDSTIGRVAEHSIEAVVGPELIAGSTRLRAGTAQKLVLNMLSTATMVKLGKTFGNVMVDLRATNQKLYARSLHAVMLITDVTPDQAAEALRRAGGSVKEATLMLLTGLEPERARDVLKAEPSLRAALTSFAVRPPQ